MLAWPVRSERREPPRSPAEIGGRLCDDVGKQLAFDLRDLVLEQQLAFLEALHLQLIERAVLDDPRDHVVEVAVLGPAERRAWL